MSQLYNITLRHWQWVERMGWHNTTQLEKMALVASEVGEAVNELRGEKPTAVYGYELADIILRVVDAGKEAGIDDLTPFIEEKMRLNELRGSKGRVK